MIKDLRDTYKFLKLCQWYTCT